MTMPTDVATSVGTAMVAMLTVAGVLWSNRSRLMQAFTRQSDLPGMSSAIDALGASLEQVSARLEAVEADNSDLRVELASVRKQLADTEAELAEVRKQRDAQLHVIASLEARVADLRAELDQYESAKRRSM